MELMISKITPSLKESTGITLVTVSSLVFTNYGEV